jgi:predicted helicase
MSQEHTERLRAIKTFPQLVVYLRDELGWEVSSDDFEELTFEYSAEELGLDSKSAAKVKEIRRLRPLVTNQPWGIFFVNFEPKRLPVVALRRVLRALVTKKRASANPSERPAWAMGDLLFISSYGEADHRDISFAHFVESQEKGDLPTLKVLGWDDEDTGLRLRDVHTRLREFLLWPEDAKDTKKWRERWSKAFLLEHREVIRTSKDLAVQMARLAQRIRKRALKVLEVESDKGPLRKMMEAFKEALIHDLDEDGFADMYAQTITYGLLTARVSREAGLVAENVVDMVPVTNPFLRDMLQMFLTVGGRKAKIDFDELGINEVVHALREANMEQVLKDFGDKNPQEDPVIHFYELFLKEYDAKKRMQRGVFYTPRPVVSYIARSVHELLQTEFGLEDGLADTTTWGEMATRNKCLKIPQGVDPNSPFVNILDPATGTATFLVEVIDLVHKTMKAKWLKQGHMALEIGKLWNEYVPNHLLPRVHGYELLMAPYAVAHMKIGLKLWETGYRFKSDERARIYLTNALEPPTQLRRQREFEDWAPALAHEAQAVNTIKRNQCFTVVIGNPPYSKVSGNMSDAAQELVERYKFVDGQALGERKHWLQDDYVKFLSLTQRNIDRSGCGVAGLITNHGFLDNPTFRGLRQSLANTFNSFRVFDLHGNMNKGERAADGSPDDNVFDIRQGVSISLASRFGLVQSLVTHSELWGSRDAKYHWLSHHGVLEAKFKPLLPSTPYYFFLPKNADFDAEYFQFTKISEAMPVSSTGILTARDHFVIDFEDAPLLARMGTFLDKRLDDEDVGSKLGLSENYAWRVADARRALLSEKGIGHLLRDLHYRPFDTRRIVYHPSVVWRVRKEVMRHLTRNKNVALITSRMTKSLSENTGAFVSNPCAGEVKQGEIV